MLLHSLFVAFTSLVFLVARSRAASAAEAEAAAAAAARHARRRAARRSRVPTPPPCPQPPPPGSDPRLQLVSGAVALLVQVLSILRWTAAGSRARHLAGLANMGSVMVLELVLLILVPALAPRFYRRHSQAVLGATRLAYFSLPYIRDPQDVQAVLQGQPSQRLFAGATDLFTLTLAARGLALLMGPLICPLPLLPHLALAAYAVQRTRTTAYMCAQPMLQHATWRRRIAWVHRLAEALPLLVPRLALAGSGGFSGVQGISNGGMGGMEGSGGMGGSGSGMGGSGGGGRAEELDCRVFVTFYQLLLGLLLPTLVLAALQRQLPPAPLAQPAQPAQAQRQDRTRRGRRHRGGRSRGVGGSGGASGCAAWLCWVAAEAEGGVQHLCDMLTGRAGPPLLAAAAWWALLSCGWVAALALELLSWDPPGQAAPAGAAAAAAAAAGAALAGGSGAG